MNILKSKEDIELELNKAKELRTEYFESVKNYESVKKENTEIKAELNKMVEKYEPPQKTQKNNSVKPVDTKRKIS